jgi:sRNA-binding carbon storage regulator CsrA
MLVLRRESGESIFIYPDPDVDPDMTVGELFADGPIKVVVLDVNVDLDYPVVRIGIEAQRDLTVLRDEVDRREGGQLTQLYHQGRATAAA